MADRRARRAGASRAHLVFPPLVAAFLVTAWPAAGSGAAQPPPARAKKAAARSTIDRTLGEGDVLRQRHGLTAEVGVEKVLAVLQAPATSQFRVVAKAG